MIFSGLLEAQDHAAFFSHKKAARDRKQRSFLFEQRGDAQDELTFSLQSFRINTRKNKGERL